MGGEHDVDISDVSLTHLSSKPMFNYVEWMRVQNLNLNYIFLFSCKLFVELLGYLIWLWWKMMTTMGLCIVFCLGKRWRFFSPLIGFSFYQLFLLGSGLFSRKEIFKFGVISIVGYLPSCSIAWNCAFEWFYALYLLLSGSSMQWMNESAHEIYDVIIC